VATHVTGQDVVAAEVFTVDTSRIATAISYYGITSARSTPR
jgi:hypothetical protein